MGHDRQTQLKQRTTTRVVKVRPFVVVGLVHLEAACALVRHARFKRLQIIHVAGREGGKAHKRW